MGSGKASAAAVDGVDPGRRAGRPGRARSGQPPWTEPRPFTWLLVGLALTLLIVLAVSVTVGAVSISLTDTGRVLRHHLLGGPAAGIDPVVDRIVWDVRLPRTVLAVIVGAALAVTGAVIQAVVRNPLGDPYLIGIVPGASVGAVLVIVFGSAAAGGLGLSSAAFVGGLLAFAATFALGRSAGQFPPARLVLAGVAVGYLLNAVTYFVQTVATPTQVQRVLFWTLGSLGGATWSELPVLLVVTGLGSCWLLASAARLNALVSGDDLARSLGVRIGQLQLTLMALAALLTGCIVAVVGGIGFVGLLVPHLARLLVGADHRRVLPVSLLLGGAFLPLADLVARTILAPAELPIGIVTATIGAPFFIWLLWSLGRSRGGPT